MEAISKQIYSFKGSLAIEVTGQESKTKQHWLESQSYGNYAKCYEKYNHEEARTSFLIVV